MKAIREKVQGKIYEKGGRIAVWLRQGEEAVEGVDVQEFYLRYALTVMGPETHVFPALLLDDWGNEIKKLGLYKWIRDNGELSPRAELFGFTSEGQSSQWFLRELELYFKYPLYVFPTRETALNEGKLVSVVMVTGDPEMQPEQIKRPAELDAPLRRSDVAWWRVPPSALRKFYPRSISL
jgi:hypothetical protein